MYIKRFTIAIALLLAVSAAGAPSARYDEWRNGPVKWLFTTDDERAWRDVATDDDARRFIALFWARRDPTPGTPENEYRDEFDHRVAAADIVFPRGITRGALTDPGRVLIILGAPDYSNVPRYAGPDFLHQAAPKSTATFRYDHVVQLGLTGPIRFMAFSDGRYILSPEHNSHGALAEAINRAIVNPSLTTVPSWAAAGPNWLRFHVAMVRASSKKEYGLTIGIPPELKKALADVRQLLPYKSYLFVDAIAFSAQSTQPATALMGQPAKPYRVTLRFDQGAQSLDVSPFRVQQSDGAEVVSTSFSIKPGETLSVGTSKRGDTNDAILFFVTCLAD